MLKGRERPASDSSYQRDNGLREQVEDIPMLTRVFIPADNKLWELLTGEQQTDHAYKVCPLMKSLNAGFCTLEISIADARA
jgi:hypothetical protein